MRKTFWEWLADNPMTVLMIFLVLLGFAALIFGYKEGVMSIITGIFTWTKGNDAENRQKLEEAKRNSDMQFSRVYDLADGMKEQQKYHDEEVDDDVWCAKAECDDMDVDELIDIGNAMLRDHSAFGGQESQSNDGVDAR